MKPEQAARNLAVIGTVLLILASLVRVLAAYILTIDTRFLPHQAAAASDRSPVMGLYHLSPNGRQVTFSRGVTIPTDDPAQTLWTGNSYSLDLDNGAVSSGAPDREMTFFNVSGSSLVILDPTLKQSLADVEMAVFAVSQDGSNLAYAVASDTGNWRLYAVRGGQPPEQLDEKISYADLSWSSDMQSLLFVAPVMNRDQVFQYDFERGGVEQITSDATRKHNPVYSPDGKQVAYLADVGEGGPSAIGRITPTPLTLPPLHGPDPMGTQPFRTEIFTIGVGEKTPTQLTDNEVEEFDLGWAASGQVIYSVWQMEWPMVAWLYGINPESQEVRRIYPPVAIDALTCTPDLWGKNQATVQLEISNTGIQAEDVPLEIAMDRAPLDVITARSQHRAQRDDLRFDPGEVRKLEYTVPVVSDQKAFLAATIETGVEFPSAALYCEVEPRTLLLPRLRWFGVTLGMVVFGYLLSIPWLRHQKNPWLWRIWALFLVLLAVLAGMESAAVLGVLG